jgi:hypothetical protein
MPFPDHYLLQWGGDFVSDPGEIWSNGIRFCTQDAVSGNALPAMTSTAQQTMASAALGVLTANMTATGAQYSSNVRLKFAKFNRIDSAGAYNDKTTTHAAYAAGAGVPGGSSSNYPVTAALVVTWLTQDQRGPASRGRIFVPQPSGSVAAPSYRFTAAATLQTANRYADLIEELNSAVTAAGGAGGLRACIVSQVGAGRANEITRASVGDFLDHMGSRRNNLTETRSTSSPIT